MKPSMLVAVLTVFVSALLGQQPAAGQVVHYVDNLRTCEGQTPCYSTITDAVIAASPLDTIAVLPGVYHEAVVFDGEAKRDITLRSHCDNKPVIVAPPGTASAITLRQSSGVQVVNFVLEAPEGAGVMNDGLLGATRVVLSGNLVKALRGIAFTGCMSSRVTGNWVIGGGITLSLDPRDCLVENNTVHNGGIVVGSTDHLFSDNVIRQNAVSGGSIVLPGSQRLRGTTVESNVVDSGRIHLAGISEVDGNVIQRNVVRGGGILLEIIRAFPLGDNNIAMNVVSGSAGDGVAVRAPQAFGGSSVITDNTSVENAGCDINDSASVPGSMNTWVNNRFGTACGSATE